MKGTHLIALFAITLLACGGTPPDQQLIDPSGKTVETRFLVPKGYERLPAANGSFGHYLRNLPLKPDGSTVNYYDGTTKDNANVYTAVVDMEISNRDLQQCADAVMRLRGEFLFKAKRWDDLHFNFLSDGKPRYYRDKADASKSYKSFRSWMEWIFAFANTRSLHAELTPVDWGDLQIGDVFIQTGNPYGHAVIIVDVAVNKGTDEKLYMLAQSYMPAQETQILCNPYEGNLSPWYSDQTQGKIHTPEWTFEQSDLRRFPTE